MEISAGRFYKLSHQLSRNIIECLLIRHDNPVQMMETSHLIRLPLSPIAGPAIGGWRKTLAAKALRGIGW